MVENSYSPDKNSKQGRTNTLLNKMTMPAFMRPRSPARKRALSAISLSRSFGKFLCFCLYYQYIKMQLSLQVSLVHINKSADACGFVTLAEKNFKGKVHFMLCATAITHRNSHRRRTIKRGILKNLAKFTRKHLCWGLFFDKVAGHVIKEVSNIIPTIL